MSKQLTRNSIITENSIVTIIIKMSFDMSVKVIWYLRKGFSIIWKFYYVYLFIYNLKNLNSTMKIQDFIF